jgi:hypothetical protein
MPYKVSLEKCEELAKQKNNWVSVGPDAGSHECVAAVKALAGLILPNTALWRRGRKVRGRNTEMGPTVATFIEPGTVIATFPITVDERVKGVENGTIAWVTKKSFRYKGHAAIFVGYTHAGIEVHDQYASSSFSKREIKYKCDGYVSADAAAFYIVASVEVPPDESALCSKSSYFRY